MSITGAVTGSAGASDLLDFDAVVIGARAGFTRG
jgi:hypothetical protein